MCITHAYYYGLRPGETAMNGIDLDRYLKETAMNGIDMDRYLRDDALRAALEARARFERAQTVQRLVVAAARFLAGLPGRLRRRAAALRPASSTARHTRVCH